MNSSCQEVEASTQLALFDLPEPVKQAVAHRVGEAPARLKPPSIGATALPPRRPLPMLPLNQNEWSEDLIETVRLAMLDCLDWPCDEGNTTDEIDEIEPMQHDLYPDEWTDDGIRTLRERLLKRLKGLKDGRTFKEEKRACIRWITEPLHARCELSTCPFSFQVCCYATGVDPEELRDQLLWSYAPVMLPFIRAVDDWRLRNLVQRVRCNTSNPRDSGMSR